MNMTIRNRNISTLYIIINVCLFISISLSLVSIVHTFCVDCIKICDVEINPHIYLVNDTDVIKFDYEMFRRFSESLSQSTHTVLTGVLSFTILFLLFEILMKGNNIGRKRIITDFKCRFGILGVISFIITIVLFFFAQNLLLEYKISKKVLAYYDKKLNTTYAITTLQIARKSFLVKFFLWLGVDFPLSFVVVFLDVLCFLHVMFDLLVFCFCSRNEEY
ncbi:MAG: hypothetical protein J7K98_02185 [Candidatus Aenigmarchaeota archaeon]|nr:hypothetical protein [Candidatus Aenigmarchaeota archaeon]